MPPTPAFSTRHEIAPKSRRTRSANATTDANAERSSSIASTAADVLRALMAAHASAPRATDRHARMTWKPCTVASSRAVWKPMPVLAPVTMATRILCLAAPAVVMRHASSLAATRGVHVLKVPGGAGWVHGRAGCGARTTSADDAISLAGGHFPITTPSAATCRASSRVTRVFITTSVQWYGKHVARAPSGPSAMKVLRRSALQLRSRSVPPVQHSRVRPTRLADAEHG